MAAIIPIKGIRYNLDKIPGMNYVVTPPYDVIDQEAQENYYQKNPYNIIRLEYGKTFPSDGPDNNRYTRAAALFKQWVYNDILKRDNEPALYLYEQEFVIDGQKNVRTGFICAVKIEPYDKGVILPHEETLPKHKKDRLELMNACKCNFSPVFSLYTDKNLHINKALKDATASREPDTAFADENNEIHRLWVITDQEKITLIQKIMAGKRIFIADGHHRYETALVYKNQQNIGDQEEHPANYIMMMLVNLYDPGLVVLPTHRLVKNINPGYISSLLKNLEQDFILEEHEITPQYNLKAFLNRLSSLGSEPAGTSSHRHVFGIYLGGGKLYMAALKDEQNLPKLMPKEKSIAWQNLDVSVLHKLVLEKHLGIGPELLAKGDNITYTREEEKALEEVDQGKYQLALFLNPTKVEEVTEVAANSEKMPQKSTYFYPKVISGMVINPLF